MAWRVAALAPPRVDRLILVDATGYDVVPAHVPLGFQVARIPVFNRISEFLTPRALVEASVKDVRSGGSSNNRGLPPPGRGRARPGD